MRKYKHVRVEGLESFEELESLLYTMRKNAEVGRIHSSRVRAIRLNCSSELFERIHSSNCTIPVFRCTKFSKPVHGRIGTMIGLPVYDTASSKAVEGIERLTFEYCKVLEEDAAGYPIAAPCNVHPGIFL